MAFSSPDGGLGVEDEAGGFLVVEVFGGGVPLLTQH